MKASKMKKAVLALTAAGVLGGLVSTAMATTPSEDLHNFRDYFYKKFPGVSLNEFGNGVYGIDPKSRETWEAIEEFPPYEIAIDQGEELFNTPFKNGKTYASCFKNGGIGIRQNFPFYSKAEKQVKTLEQVINECRTKNGEKALKWKKGKLAAISSYMAYTSRGKVMNVKTPKTADEIKWYEKGRKHFYGKRGQLNMSCANCHVDNAGNYIRADILSPALGHVSHFPVYRAKWGGLGTMHRRYGGCNKQVRSLPLKAQSDEYKALEYFHSYMSNGIEVNGPGSRK
ncbi:sulfur oxidation c-type cytochrome SoxA [sulfur-oxidizing endosymbiont of Gigantopelta aegis]|uniref:sulfur oxidation c-type cytochrome SoxA n=1 Tax=sulfur-oxidizing endosymbiont of Gigantopelta aegis TaxID=2794934 RepID=UPI001FEC722B|nr:sulfur oxidation c-type cytochrome SoxA [sulfur-oxidizing endosymbiont of Gigantopelta aegis]